MLQELLEQQVEKGERRAEEQTRIAKAREELLELKLRLDSLFIQKNATNDHWCYYIFNEEETDFVRGHSRTLLPANILISVFRGLNCSKTGWPGGRNSGRKQLTF